MLKINRKFAKKYDDYRRKEELQKFKDRYGDVKLSEAKQRAAGNDASASGSASSSSSESEDSNCEGWTPGMEAGFLRVYAALQAGDARLMDPTVSWFQEGEGDGDKGEAGVNGEKDRHRPMYYNEYHRKYLLEGAYQKDDAETAGEAARADPQAAEKIRRALAESHAKDSDDGEGDAFLVRRRRPPLPPPGSDGGRRASASAATANGDGDGDSAEDPVLRLHKFVSDVADVGGGLGDDEREDLAKLKRHWTNESGLTEAERYLRDFITKEYWRQQAPQQRQPSDDDGSDSEARLSADEDFLARQSEFEARWNGRTEERDPGFESGYRRTFASGDRLTVENDEEEEEDDDELFVVAKKAAAGEDEEEKLEEKEEQAAAGELLRLERRRQWRLDDPGDEDAEDAAAQDAAAPGAPGIRSYPRRIADSLRQSASDTVRSRRRSELRERRRAEKRQRRREFDRLVALKEAELARQLERLRRNAGIGEGEGEDRLAGAVGGDFLEADFDPAEHDRRMARLFGEEFYGEGEDGDQRRPRFSDDEDLLPEDEAEALRRRLQDEADRLGAEDLIRSGPGQADLRCRFNYREVEPNDFGLTPVEILLADDSELNAWCSVRKTSQYREREADRRDRRRYRSARLQEKKARLMQGMMKRLEAATAFPDAGAWAAAATAAPDGDGEGDGVPVASGKRRRRKAKRKLTGESGAGDDEAAAGADVDRAPRSRKKVKQQTPPAKKPKLLDDEEKAEVMAKVSPQQQKVTRKQQQQQKQQQKQQQQQQQKKKAASAGRLQISEQRLLELGIDPKRFRRMRTAAAATAAAKAE